MTRQQARNSPLPAGEGGPKGRVRGLILHPALLCALLLTATPLLAQSAKMYTGVWPGKILVMDETSGNVEGEIPFKNGVAYGMTLSPDKTKFYAITGLMEGIEVVDIATRQVTDAFTVSSGNRKIRLMRSVAIHPDGNRLVVPIRVAVKEIDRYTIEKPQLAIVDIREKKITRTMELPPEYSGAGGLMRFAPDGKTMYWFFRDILMIDIDQFKIVDKIETSRPLYPGTGVVRLGRSFDSHDNPDSLVFIFSSNDPATNRGMMGIATFNLVDRSLDFFELSPGVPFSGFAVSPDGERGYGVRTGPGLGEYYVYDLRNKRTLKKQDYEGRPRTSLKVSSNGKDVYLHGAGNTIDYFDAGNLTFKKRVELPGDFTTDLFIIPSK